MEFDWGEEDDNKKSKKIIANYIKGWYTLLGNTSLFLSFKEGLTYVVELLLLF